MQGFTSQSLDEHGYGHASGGQYVPNQFVTVPTQNRFAPLHEWVGYSMDIQNSEQEQMELQWVPVRNKRKRFNTGSPAAGTDQINFCSLSVDEKLSHMFDKLNNLEQSNYEIVKFSQQMNSVQAKINNVEQQTVNHELFLKVLAYKSIDIEARSRRCNLVFHGLAEGKNEKLAEVLRDFMWNELGIDSDDLYIDRYHRLGSLYKAKQRQRTDSPKRPIIIAFRDYNDIGRILDAAYMLKGSGYTITKDYPKEIVAARQRLMPRFKAERQNRHNKVSIEYPAKLVVNGRIIADEFPDWYQVLEHDRYKLACGNFSSPSGRPQYTERVPQAPVIQPTSQGISNGLGGERPSSPVRTYAHVVSSGVQQQPQPPYVSTSTGSQSTCTSSSARPTNVPHYTLNNAGYQTRQCGASNSTSPDTTTTTNTIRSKTSTMSYGQTSMNVNSNGVGTRDIPTYINL